MNQNAVAAFEVGRIALELKREWRVRLDDPCATDRAKTSDAHLQTAVVEKIRQILIRVPTLTLDEPGELAEVVQFRAFPSLRRFRPIAKNIGRFLAARPRPRRATATDLLIVPFIEKR